MLDSQQALWPPICLMAIHSMTIVRHPYLHSVEYILETSPWLKTKQIFVI
jgi:hypothetical protein